MMLEAGLIASRFAHYLAASGLFGMALFPVYTYPGRAEGPSARLDRWRRRALLAAAIGCLLTGLLWLAFTAANMNGDLGAAIDPAALLMVTRNTSFGHLWGLRLVLSAVAVALALAAIGGANGPPRRSEILLLLIAGALLATLAGTGHTQIEEGSRVVIHIVADASHLLAAGAWIGGLIILGFLINSSLPEAGIALQRFSGMGSIAVAVLLVSGAANSWFLVGSVSRLITTTYGQLLSLKLCFFTGMLALAAANRFWLVPSLIKNNSLLPLVQLRRHVLGEQILGALVLLIVSLLGTIEPAISQP